MTTEPTAPFRTDAVSDLLAEQILDPTEVLALRALLSEAAAPATEAELRGEAAALAAFRTARRPVHDSRSTSFMNRMTRVLTIKAAAVAIAVTGTGGVAFAANAGVLPVPADTPVVGSEAKAAKKVKEQKAAHEQKVRDWSGLCTAATAGNALNEFGKAADGTAFTRLAAAAGGIAGVPAFCADVLGTTTDVPVPPVDSAAAEGEGKSGDAGKATAPGQVKEDGSPAQGKGKAQAPGQTRKADQTAPGQSDAAGEKGKSDAAGKSAVAGKGTAPGQVKVDDAPAAGKGAGNGEARSNGPKVEQPTTTS